MRAEELRLDELIRFSEGLVDLHGARLAIHDTASLGQFRRDLIHMVGEDDARRILTRKGYFAGQSCAATMERLFQWDSLEEWLKAGMRLSRILGLAIADSISLNLDKATGCYSMEFTLQDSVEVDECLTEFGISDKSGCWGLMGFASGYASYCLGKSVYFVERECCSRGDKDRPKNNFRISFWGGIQLRDAHLFIP
jgi:predicted hydrocarbon binding protein